MRALPSSLGLFGVLFWFHESRLACFSVFTWPFWRAVLLSWLFLACCSASMAFSCVLFRLHLAFLCVLFRLHLAFLACCSVFTNLFLRALPSSLGLFGVLFCFHESLLACFSVFTWPFWRAVLFSWPSLACAPVPFGFPRWFSSLDPHGLFFCPPGFPLPFPFIVLPFVHSLCFCSPPLSVVPSLAWLLVFYLRAKKPAEKRA